MRESKIEWTHSTFNPWWGCEKVSPGCTHCYAEAFAKRVGQKVWGGDSPRRFFGDKHWNEPLKWNAAAAKSGEPWRVFCASMADVFEDREDLRDERARLFSLIDQTPALTWLLLTKRPHNVRRLTEQAYRDFAECYDPAEWRMQHNVWIGTTVEDQQRGDERVRHLLAIPAVVRFLSVEPLLGPLDLGYRGAGALLVDGGGERMEPQPLAPSQVEWVIVGTESGSRARNHEDYQRHARRVIEDCRTAGVAVHHKQCAIGSRVSHDMSEWPEDLRVREYPKPAPA